MYSVVGFFSPWDTIWVFSAASLQGQSLHMFCLFMLIGFPKVTSLRTPEKLYSFWSSYGLLITFGAHAPL